MRQIQSHFFVGDSTGSRNTILPEKVERISRVVLIATMLALICPGVVFAGLSSSCKGSDPTSSLPASGELRLKYIFVSFDEDIELTVAQHDSVFEISKWYIREQSHGNLELSSDSGIVFRPGEGFGSGETTPYAWRAEKSPWFYQEMRLNYSDPDTAQEYDEYYYGQDEDGWFYKTGSWWHGTDGSFPHGRPHYATHLNAEIFWNIREKYPDQEDNPFDAPPGEIIDGVVMVYLTSDTPFQGDDHPDGRVDGRPIIYLLVGAMRDEGPYFQDLGPVIATHSISGTCQIEYTVGGNYPSGPDAATMIGIASSYSTLHEIFHNFQCDVSPDGITPINLRDGPPNLAGLDGQYHYYFGYLNLMCQHTVGLQGVPGLGLPWFAKMEYQDWVEVVDFTNQAFKNETIYDIRSYDNEKKGKIYKLSRTQEPYTDEHFLVAFHGGMGIDNQDFDGDGKPMVRAKGLEIYHCTGNAMWDIESAFGMFSTINSDTLPDNIESLDPVTFLPAWGTADSLTGYDNYDLWPGRTDSSFDQHQGYVFDFFSKELGEYSQWEKYEFSFKTNPSCYWYENYNRPPDTPFVAMRHNPQSEPNSMFIRIIEQHNDASPPYAVVDFLPAPMEEISSPGQSVGEQYSLGQPIMIEWENYFGDYITQVDILFSPAGGVEGTFESIGQVGADTLSFEWNPCQVTEAGKIKLRFHNSIASTTCDEVCDEVFRVNGTMGEGPVIASSAEYPIIANSTDASTVFAVEVTYPDETLDMIVKMDASLMGGDSEFALLDDGVFPDLVDDDKIYTSSPQDINVEAGTHEGVVTAYTSCEGNGSWSEQTVEVVAEDTMLKFVDGSDSTGDLKTSMQGEPYANSFFMTETSDGDSEFLVLSKDNSSDNGDMFEKGYVINGVPRMYGRNSQWFGVAGLSSGGRGVCAADFDNDGDEDLFVCNNGGGTKLYQNTGTEYSEVMMAEFSSAGLTALRGSHVAAWGDYNQDGWIDLFVASVVYTGDMSDIGTHTITEAPTWSLFRNTGAGFELTSGILNATPTESAISATWNDIDGDGDLDLLVGYIDGSSDNNPRIFENQGYKKRSGDFVLEDKSSTKGIANLSINSMDWIDYNHDEYPDLLVTAFYPQQGALILKNVAGFPGRKFMVADSLATSGQWEGASVGDLDQNGEEDVVLLPHSGIPAVYLAIADSLTYKERAFTLGVKPTGGDTPSFTSGAVVADFDDDHDLDLYLGRPNSDQFFYRNMRQDGTSDPPGASDQNWIDIDLATLGNSNYSLIGAKITVEEPVSGKTWHQTVDGGSGRGGQKPNQLHFGLGEVTEDLNVHVEWPSGGTADTTGVSVNSSYDITETTAPVVHSGSLRFSHEPFPGGADWVFTWVTTNKGDIQKDIVEIKYEDSYPPTTVCTLDSSPFSLNWGGSNVEMTVFPIVTGWKHRVVWKGQFCSPDETCHFQFWVTSGVEGQSSTGGWVDFGYFDACIEEPPDPHN